MLRRYNGGKDVPFHITEMGWPSHSGPRGRDPGLCAAYLARLYLLGRTLPYLRGIWWYDFQDDGWNREHNEHNFGVVRPDLTPKPAYHALADIAALAAEGKYLGRVQTEDEDLWILRFQHGGREVWALWSADDKPRQVVLARPAAPKAPGARAAAAAKKWRLREVGRPPVETSWGFRAWADKRGARLEPEQFSLVVAAMPSLLGGDLEGVRVEAIRER
jgi:hypothetical protein